MNGQTIKIKNPKIKVGSSKEGLKDLIHIEKQINDMSIMPDFGYQQDNYILQKGDSQNKWKLLSELLQDQNKFGWLVNHIKLSKLESQVKRNEELVEKQK